MSFDDYPILVSNITALSAYGTALAVIAAVLLDAIFGEVKRWHPLVGFGWLAAGLEQYLNKSHLSLIASVNGARIIGARVMGLCAWFLLIVPLVLLSYFATQYLLGWLANVLLLYFAIGARSLKQHAQQIYTPLSQHNLAAAQYAVSMIVSRDTATLNETAIATATVESVLENGNDAIFGAIFWFVLLAGVGLASTDFAGSSLANSSLGNSSLGNSNLAGAGALMFRLANTLDAMWGYRTPRFVYFGWAAARLDDVLNLIPARLTALSYALCGNTGNALKCWATQASTWYSPNAGPVMSAGAGALNVKLGGAAIYHGQLKQRPTLGLGETAKPAHILAAITLVNRSLILWCAAILLTQILFTKFSLIKISWSTYFA